MLSAALGVGVALRVVGDAVTVAVSVRVTVALAVCVTVAVLVCVTVVVRVASGRVAVGRSDAVPLVGLGDTAEVSVGVALGVALGVSLGASLGVWPVRVRVGSVRAGPVTLVVAVRDTDVGSVTEPPPLQPAATAPTASAATTVATARRLRTCPPMSDCAVRRPRERVTLPV
ncbi:hypothetical protein [Intrasporangium flavum]|uniref:hypothetical protein n=1 Tax=Intrasporangium flavum TaxID=1428657 RepID=UPI00096D0ED8|nr:hypothetical protein [Intrasporangium flavum]